MSVYGSLSACYQKARNAGTPNKVLPALYENKMKGFCRHSAFCTYGYFV